MNTFVVWVLYISATTSQTYDPSVVQAFARIEAEALARGRMEGAKVMQESIILKLDECCEPCFQCNQNVTAMDAAAIVKGLNDADR